MSAAQVPEPTHAPTSPDGIWTRVYAARVAMESALTERDARDSRGALALALADAIADGEDVTTMASEYARAREAHHVASTVAAAAREELRAARGHVCSV